MIIIFAILLHNSSQAQSTSGMCMQVGQNTGDANYYAASLMYKDVFKTNGFWYTFGVGTTPGCGGWECGVDYAIPYDTTGFPSAGVPTYLANVRNGSGVYMSGSFSMGTFCLRDNRVPYPTGEYFVFWEGAGNIEINWQGGDAIVKTAGSYGTITASGVNKYNLMNGVNALGVSWSGGGTYADRIISDNTPGVHFCRIVVTTVSGGVGGNIYDNSLATSGNPGIQVILHQGQPAPNHLRELSIIMPDIAANSGGYNGTNKASGAVPYLPANPYSSSYANFINPAHPEFFKTQIFNPAYLNWLRPFKVLRFMPGFSTNSAESSTETSWLMRKKQSYFNWSTGTQGLVGKPMPIENMIQLCNTLKADAWINPAICVDLNYKQELARQFHRELDPNLKVLLAIGNEATWNYAPGFNSFFLINNYALQNGLGDNRTAMAIVEKELFDAFEEEYGADSARFRRVLEGQAVNDDQLGPRIRWHQQNNQKFDYLSIAWYFGVDENYSPLNGTSNLLSWNSTPAQVNSGISVDLGHPWNINQITGNGNHNSLARVIRNHANLARSSGSKLALYEGGSHAFYVQNGRENWHGVALHKQTPTIRPVYKQALDTLRSYPEMEIAAHFLDFGGFNTNNNLNVESTSFGSTTSCMTDTTSGADRSLTRDFGTFTYRGTDKHQSWKELVANQPNPTICNPPTMSDTVAAGLAVRLDDTYNQYINANAAGTFDPLATSNYTMEVWVKPEKYNKTQDILAYSNAVNPTNVLRINNLNRIEWNLNNGATILTGYPIVTSKWYHIAAVKNGNALSLFINGTLAASGSASGSATTSRFTMGALNTSSVTNHLRGQIDEVRIWNTSISLVQLRNYMCKRVTGTHPNFANLTNYFQFNTINGTNLLDRRTGTANAGTLVNVVTTVTNLAHYVYSGAAIGDHSVNIYPGAWPSVSLSYTNIVGNDVFSVSNLGQGNPHGVHIYAVNQAPTLRTPPAYYTTIAGKYYGVFVANGTNPPYDVTYSWQGNPAASNNPNWNRLVRRDDGSDASWGHGGARIDAIQRVLILSCKEKSRSEYILGVRQNNAVNRTGSGRAMSFTDADGVLYNYKRANNYTISFWAKCYNTSGDEGGTVVRFFNGTQYNDIGYGIGTNGSNIGVRNNDITVENAQLGNVYSGYNQWSHYAITRTGSLMNLFINGFPATSGEMLRDTAFNEMHIAGRNNFYSDEFDGALDELSVWNTPLSITEIRQLMCKKITTSHPKYCNLDLYFNFDEGAGNILENRLGEGDLVFSGQYQWTTSGAALGNESAYNYNSQYGGNLPHPDGDFGNVFTNYLNSNRYYGTQIYRVDGNPEGAGLPGGVTAYDSTRYWGIYAIPAKTWNSPYHNLIYTYNYGLNTKINIPLENTLVPIVRPTNEYPNWTRPVYAFDYPNDKVTVFPTGFSITGINTGSDYVTCVGHGVPVGQCIAATYYTDATAITGLTPNTDQLTLIAIDANTFYVRDQYALGGCSGGNGRDIQGTIPAGNHVMVRLTQSNGTTNANQVNEILMGASTVAAFNFNNLPPGSIAGITGKSVVCQGETGLIYRVTPPLPTNTTYYKWYSSPGLATNLSGRDTVVVNVLATAPSTQYLTVVGFNNIGQSAPRILTINVQATGALSADIQGVLNICQGSTSVYSISGVSPTPLSYIWSVTGSATITGPNNGLSANISFLTSTITSAAISVYGQYSCGLSLINSLNVTNNRAPNITLPVVGDSLCAISSLQNLYIKIYGSESGVTYEARYLGNTIVSAAGMGSTLTLPFPKTTLGISFTASPITIRATSVGCTPVNLTQTAPLLHSTTLTNAQLSPTWLGPALTCYNGNGVPSFIATLTGAVIGVNYAAMFKYFDINGSQNPFEYKIGPETRALTNPMPLEVDFSSFPYWISLNNPNTISGYATSPACPTQKLLTDYHFVPTRARGVTLPSRITGPGQGLRPPGDNDYDICGGQVATYYTTSNGGSYNAFHNNIINLNFTNGNTDITYSVVSGANTIAVNDVIYITQNGVDPNGLPNGANFQNWTPYFVTNVAGSTIRLGTQRGGGNVTPNFTATNIRAWRPVTVDIAPNQNTITISTAKWGAHNLKLYSQVRFRYAYRTPNLNSGGGGDLCVELEHANNGGNNCNNDTWYYVTNINGDNIQLSVYDDGIWGVNKSQPFFMGRGTITYNTGSNQIIGFATDFQNQVFPGYIIRDIQDRIIGTVASVPNAYTINLTGNAALNSGGYVRYSSNNYIEFGGTSGESVVLEVDDNANANGYSWSITPPNAVTNIAAADGAGGGAYNAAAGTFIGGNSLSNTATYGATAGSNYKNGITVTFNPNFSGNIYIEVSSSNNCGPSNQSYDYATPGYERTRVLVNVQSPIPSPPGSLLFTDIPYCQNSSSTNFSTYSDNAAGGYQWQLLNAGSSSINPSAAGSCYGGGNPCAWSRVSTVLGVKAEPGGGWVDNAPPCNTALPGRPCNSGASAEVTWANGFSGVATIRVRTYGCGDFHNNMLASSWTYANVTIGGKNTVVQPGISGPTAVCQGTPTSLFTTPAGQPKYFIRTPGAIGDILPGMIAYYPFNTSSAANQSISPWSLGGLINGTLQNGASYGFDLGGNAGGALSLTGGNQHVLVPTNSSMEFENEDFTLAAWIRYTPESGGANRHIMRKGDNYFLMLTGPDADKRLSFNTQVMSPCCPGTTVTISGAIPTNTWIHVAAVVRYDPTMPTGYGGGYQITGYINGILSGVNTIPSANINESNGTSFMIGVNWNENMRGGIDEVMVFNKALSSSEVSGIHSLNAVKIVDNTDYIGEINTQNGLLTWVSTFVGPATVVVGSDQCGGIGLSSQQVFVYPRTTILGVTASDPIGCSALATGNISITVAGVPSTMAGSLFNVSWNGDLISEGTASISGIGVINFTSGLLSGTSVTGVYAWQMGSTCYATPQPFAYNYVMGGVVQANSTLGVNVNGVNPICQGNNSGVDVPGAQNGVSYYAMIGANTVSGLRVGTGSTLTLTIPSNFVSTPGVNTVRVIAFTSGCPQVTLAGIGLITVNGVSTSGTLAGNALAVCAGNTTQITLTGFNGIVNFESSNDGVTYSFVGNGTGTPRIFNTAALTQNTWYRAVVQNTPCSTVVSNILVVTVTSAPTVPGFVYAPICASAGTGAVTTLSGSFNGTYVTTAPGAQITVNATNGTVTVVAGNTLSGIYWIRHVIPASGGCASVAGYAAITITGIPLTPVISYGVSPYCNNNNIGLTSAVNTTAGTQYFASAGAAVGISTGIISSGAATGIYTITAFNAGAVTCSATSVSGTAVLTITALPATPNFNYGGPICPITSIVGVTTVSGLFAGTYSTTAPGSVFTINASTGTITLASATVSGTYWINHVIPASGGCAAVTGSSSVIITTSPPNPIISYGASPYCNNNNIGLVSGVNTTAGTLYYGTAGITVAVNTGVVSSGAAGGVYTVTAYNIGSGACSATSATGIAIVTITSLPTAPVFNYGAGPYCANSAPISVITTSGIFNGAWVTTAPGSAVTLNSSGTITISANTVSGTYWINHIIAAAGGCTSIVGANSVTVTPLPAVPIFNYGATPFCANVPSVPVTVISGVTGGTFNTTATGFSVNGSTGNITGINTSLSGSFIVNYTIPASGGCPAVFSISGITFNAAPAAGVASGTGASICYGTTATLTLSGHAGTIAGWQYSTDGGSTWTFNAVTSPTYTSVTLSGATIFNAVVGNGVCANVTSAGHTINVTPQSSAGTITPTIQTPCVGSPANFTAAASTGTVVWEVSTVAGMWSTIPGTAISASYTLNNGIDYFFRIGATNGAGCFTNFSNIATATGLVCAVSANATSTGTNVCLSTASSTGITFTDLSTTPTTILGRVWYVYQNGSLINTVGFGITPSGYNISFTFPVSGPIAVVLSVVGTGAATNSITITGLVDDMSLAGTISSVSPNPLCYDFTANLSVASTRGTATWLTSNDGSTWVNTGVTTSTYAQSNRIANSYYAISAVNGVCPVVTSTSAFVVTVRGQSVGGTVSSNTPLPVCENTTANLTVSGQLGTLQWENSPDNSAWTAVSGATTPGIATINIPLAGYYYRIVAANGAGCTPANSPSLLVTAQSCGVVSSFTGLPNPICLISASATGVSFTDASSAVSTIIGRMWDFGTGATPATANIGLTSSGYNINVTYNTSGTKTVTLTVIGVGGVTTVYTQNITIDDPSLAGSVSVTTNPICYNTAASLTLAGERGTVSWIASADNITYSATGSSGTSYTSANLTSNNYYGVIVSNASCPAVTITGTMVTVIGESISGTVSSTSTLPICSNSPAALQVTGSQGNIQWEQSPDGSVWSAISGANTATYNTPNLTTDTYYRVSVVSGAGCSTVSSGFQLITTTLCGLTAQITPDINPICLSAATGTGITFTDNSSSVSTILGRMWDFGFGASPATASVGITTSGYSIPVTYNTAGVFSVSLTVIGVSTTNIQTINVTITSPSIGGSVSGPTSGICNTSGIATLNLTGNNGAIQWQDSPDGSTWSNMSGETSSTLNIAAGLTADRYYQAVVTNGICAAQSSSLFVVTVLSASSGGTAILLGSSTVCIGNTYNLSLTGTIIGSILGWERSAPGNTSYLGILSTVGFTSYTPNFSEVTGTEYYRAVVQNGVGCISQNSAEVQINGTPCTVSATIAASPATLCLSTATSTGVMLTLTGTSAGPIIGYTISGTDIAVPFIYNTSATLTVVGPITFSTPGTKTIDVRVLAAGNNQNFASTSVTVEPFNNAGTPIVAATIICQGQTAQLNTTGATQGTITYQLWDGFAYNDIVGNTYANVQTSNSPYQFRAKASGGTCPDVFSNAVNVNVQQQAAITSVSQPSALGNYCLGAVVTGLSATYTPTSATGFFISSGPISVATNGNFTATVTVPSQNITFTIPGVNGCAGVSGSTSISVNVNPAIDFAYARDNYCKNYDPEGDGTYVSATNIVGAGTFSADANLSLTDPNLGTINLSASNIGTWNVTFTGSPISGCPANTISKSITIKPNPTVTGVIEYPDAGYGNGYYCSTDFATRTPNAPTVPFGYTGSFISTNILVNAANGTITPSSAASPGFKNINYVVAPDGCNPYSYPAVVSITGALSADAININYLGEPCIGYNESVSPVTTILGYAAGVGRYLTNKPDDLKFVVGAEGVINVAQSKPGSYSIIYTVPGFGGCDPFSKTTNITLHQKPSAKPTLSYGGKTLGGMFCNNYALQPDQADELEGKNATFTGTGGIEAYLNANTGQIDLNKAPYGNFVTPKVYIVSYVMPVKGACPAEDFVSNEFTITLTSAFAGKSAIVGGTAEKCEGDNISLELAESKGFIQWEVSTTDTLETSFTALSDKNATGPNSTQLTYGPLSQSVYLRAYMTLPDSVAYCNGVYDFAKTAAIKVNLAKKPVAGTVWVNPNSAEKIKEICLEDFAVLTLSGYSGTITWYYSSEETLDVLKDTVQNANAAKWKKIVDPNVSADIKTPIVSTPILSGYDNKVFVGAVVNGLNGCATATAYTKLVLVKRCDQNDDIPNVITPNTNAGGDPNSVWNIQKLRLTEKAEVRIFNRYGVEVWFSRGDAITNGKMWTGDGLPAGTYYYHINKNDNSPEPVLTGFVTVIK
ncbi:MAG: LamG-like jellyroll fold domain-containing protein [Cytophagales bacterium]|nr:LamG-like jellyroll fold domain-containing protein [Cytophagales bacterium]